jgi:hypothetical protein
MLSETYNSLIAALSQMFTHFTPKELCYICHSFSVAGLRQDDIINHSVNKMQEVFNGTDGERMRSSFQNTIG